ncbi:MAG: EpsG family protein [Oscillospiraceae bacterium]|nr:EpsG family protein [Oscillospiraceae bacterium]
MTSFFNYIYDINLLLIAGLGLGLNYYKPSDLKKSNIKKIIFLSVTGAFMLFIFVSRYGIGFDYFNYYTLLNQCKTFSFLELLTYKGPVEPGFAVLLKLISFITNDIVIMYLILGIIMLLVLNIYIYKYSTEPWVSVYLFVGFGFMFGVMNLFRQYFVAIVFLFAIKYIQNKNFCMFLLVTLICASIHKSALIILPVYFIARLDINWKTLTFFGSLTLLAYIFCDYAINFITQYIYTDYNLETGELKRFMGGMPWQFVIVPFIYCLTAVLMKNKLLKKDPGNIVLINFSIYTLILWILMTKHLLLERASNFFYISSILLGAQLVSCLNPDQNIKQRLDEIKNLISQMKKNNNKGKALESKNHELKKIQEEYSESKAYYVTAIVSILILGFLNQVFATSHGNHAVFPYKSIFTRERDTNRENSIKQISEQQND